jgi:hypothetical protein
LVEIGTDGRLYFAATAVGTGCVSQAFPIDIGFTMAEWTENIFAE